MNIALQPQTQKLLEEQMQRGRFATADEALHTALQTMAELSGEPIEQLDEATQAALGRAFAQSDRGEGRDWSEVRAEIVAKYLPGK